MKNKVIQNFIAKMVAGRSDDGIMITLRDPKKVQFQAAMLEDLLMRNGINPNAITSEAQLKSILNQIEAFEKKNLADNISGIRNTTSAKVFDLEGKEIPRGSKIMGGKEVPGTSERDRVRNEMKTKYGFTDERLDEIENTPIDEEMADRLLAETDQPPLGSRGGDEDIAAPVQSAEESLKDMTEAELKANLEKQNKSAVENILKRKNREDVYGLEDYDTTNMSEIKKEIIRTETKLGNLNPNTPGFRERAKPLIDKITALQKKLREDKADGGRIGFFMGSKLPKGLATLRNMLNYMGNKSDKVQYPSEVLKMVNPKSLNKMLEDPRLQVKVNIKEGILASDMVKDFQSKMGEDRVQLVRDMLDAAKNIKRSDDKILAYKNEIKERMMKDLNMSEAEADRAATAMSRLAMDITKMPNTPKLTDEGILELENVLKNMETGGKKKRDLNADGGIMRLGLKEGSGMSRRTFLKFLAGAASIPIVGKIFKPLKIGKTVTKVPIIKTDDVAGKPEWFDQLVNKVILEGDDVSKRFATVDRETVHMKKLDDDNQVLVYQDVDAGTVRVEYNSADNMFGEQVDLRYKKPNPDEGDPRPSAEFEVEESGIVGRADGPDDYSMEVEGMGGSSISDLESDLTRLKTYATGQKPTIKELADSMKRKKNVRYYETPEGQTDYVTTRQGDEVPDYDDMASGGIARMLGE